MSDLKDPTALRAQMAVLSIYRDLGIPAGDVLSIREIAQHWADYGVRAADLMWALDALVRDGLLARMPGAPDRMVLTAVGENWLRQQPPWLEYRLLVPRAARARAKRRQGTRAASRAMQGRRAGDPPAAKAERS